MSFTKIPSSNRLEWLQYRKFRPTSTEIAAAAANPSALNIMSIAIDKRRPPEELSTQAMDFGHAREEALIEFAKQNFPDEDIVHNEELCINDDDDSVAATPDGLGINCTVECKTHNNIHRTEAPQDHYDQTQIAMYAADKKFCIYVCEIHENFVPVTIWYQIIERDDERIAELLDVAAMIRDAMESEPLDEINEKKVIDYIDSYATLDESISVLTDRRDALKERILNNLGRNYVYVSVDKLGTVDATDKTKETLNVSTLTAAVEKINAQRIEDHDGDDDPELLDVDDLIEKFTKPPKTPALDKNKLREEMPELAELAIEVTIEPNIVIRPSKTTVEKIQSKLHVYDADRKEYSDDNPFAH